MLLSSLLFAVALALPPYAEGGAVALPAESDPFVWQVEPAILEGVDGRLSLRLVVPPGHVIYRDMLEIVVLDAGPLSVGAVDLPPAQVKEDPADGLDPRPLYPEDVVVWLPLHAPDGFLGGATLKVETRHQGCRPGLCFPPTTLTHDVLVAVRPAP